MSLLSKLVFFLVICVSYPVYSEDSSTDNNLPRTEFNCLAFSDMAQEDCEALVMFYHETNGDEWTDNSGWMEQSQHPCSWFGIVCRPIALPSGSPNAVERVVAVLLQENNLSGSFPTSVFKFSFLQLLVLDHNLLVGQLPEDIGRLGYLFHFDISDNQFIGLLPSSIIDLSKLQVLDLTNNQFTGSLPEQIGQLKLMRMADFSRNLFTGKIPASILDMATLSFIDFTPQDNHEGLCIDEVILNALIMNDVRVLPRSPNLCQP